jgi:hypothetical protein
MPEDKRRPKDLEHLQGGFAKPEVSRKIHTCSPTRKENRSKEKYLEKTVGSV